ncbi:MAG: hypothetical protein BA861_02780 [Desulfobacterales bacterium S3730MH5]|nr:MAG: hypothetical protein BA861_02780 [Desulfobacterales bacterium S3730MH5]
MKINWHRLFGLLLMDYFSDRGFSVELEKDLSLKRQYLDVVILEHRDQRVDLSGICDGFDNLSRHNLLTYKSKGQSLNLWAIEELIGHYVNYRKVLGRSKVRGEDIRLYAVSTRYPAGLLSGASAREVTSGVYEIQVLSREVRVIVISRLPLQQRNAVLAFFSFDPGKVTFALQNYTWHIEDGSTVINQLLEKYSLEGIDMPYTMEQFRKDYIKAHLTELDPEDRLRGLKAEERLRGLEAEERLRGLKIEEVESYLKKLKKRN